MPSRNSTKVAGVLLAACLICVFMAWVCFRPTVTFQVTHELVGPADARVWALLSDGAPLDDIKQAVRETGKHPDQMVWVGGSLLSNAVDEQRRDLVIWLIEQGANPNGVHPSTSPLNSAVWKMDTDMARLLIEKGADPNVGSPLLSAISNNDANMVRLLIEHGADPDLSIDQGASPRDVAVHKGNPEVIKAIKQDSTSDMPGK